MQMSGRKLATKSEHQTGGGNVHQGITGVQGREETVRIVALRAQIPKKNMPKAQRGTALVVRGFTQVLNDWIGLDV